MKLLSKIDLLAESALTPREIMTKDAKSGPYTGMPRAEIFLLRVKNGDEFELNNGKKVKIDAIKSKPILDALRTGEQKQLELALKAGKGTPQAVIFTVGGGAHKLSEFKKDAAFGGESSGSGGGAASTNLRESSTALVCALRGAHDRDLLISDVEVSSLSEVATHALTTSTFREMVGFLQSPVELNSAVLTANAIYSHKPLDRSMQWHRGSAWVKELEKTFNKVNKNEGRFFVNINKWSPADIWAVKPGIKVPTEVDSFAELNKWINTAYNNGEVVGVSLKLVSKKATAKTVNDSYADSDFIKHTIKRLLVSKRNELFGSKDAHIVFEHTLVNSIDTLIEKEIQYRSFSGDDPIQGQITGKNAAHGKIGHGPTNKFLERLNLPTLTSRNEIFAMIDKTTKDPEKRYFTVVQKIINMASTVDPSFSNIGPAAMKKYAKEMTPSMMISKFQAVELMSILAKAPRAKRTKFINNIIGYAGSATDLSATYMKVS